LWSTYNRPVSLLILEDALALVLSDKGIVPLGISPSGMRILRISRSDFYKEAGVNMHKGNLLEATASYERSIVV